VASSRLLQVVNKVMNRIGVQLMAEALDEIWTPEQFVPPKGVY
jgi:hypothetical protein